MDADLIQKIEAQRLELEANIAQLRRSLHHWTTLELDYEGLKDEFRILRDGTTKDECLKIAREFQPHKVNEKELVELIEPSRGRTRSPIQIVEVLSKRVDYVLRNADTLRKQISDLEKKRNAVLLAARPELEADAILPIMEITEDLDDNGDVKSSRVQKQGDSAKKVLEVLEKAKGQSIDTRELNKTPIQVTGPRVQEVESSDEEDDPISDQHQALDGKASTVSVLDTASTESNLRPTDSYLLNPDDNEEEAQMRQEMINYGLGEVGNIVAELELMDASRGQIEDEDEEMIDDLDDDYNGEQDYSEESFDEESEDESGRSRAKVHSDKYRHQMEELEKQLGFKMENAGPASNNGVDSALEDQIERLRDSEFEDEMNHLPPEFRKRFGQPTPAEAARKAAIAREAASRTAVGKGDEDNKKAKLGKRKSVAFAPSVDVAPESSRTKSTLMNETITEHSTAKNSVARPDPPTKVSHFRAARASQPQRPLLPPPMESPSSKQDRRTGPAGKTIAQDLVERAESLYVKEAPAPDADDFDEELQQRQIALEHHQLRNRMIHESGGYVKGGEAENWGEAYAAPRVEDEKTGQPVKISRFKAARLRP